MTLKRNFDFLMTHREIADELGVSLTRVMQIEASALRKLRAGLDIEEPRKWSKKWRRDKKKSTG